MRKTNKLVTQSTAAASVNNGMVRPLHINVRARPVREVRARHNSRMHNSPSTHDKVEPRVDVEEASRLRILFLKGAYKSPLGLCRHPTQCRRTRTGSSRSVVVVAVSPNRVTRQVRRLQHQV